MILTRSQHLKEIIRGNAIALGILFLLFLIFTAINMLIANFADPSVVSTDTINVNTNWIHAATFIILPLILWNFITSFYTFHLQVTSLQKLRSFHLNFALDWMIVVMFIFIRLQEAAAYYGFELVDYVVACSSMVMTPVLLYINLYYFKLKPLTEITNETHSNSGLTNEDREWLAGNRRS